MIWPAVFFVSTLGLCLGLPVEDKVISKLDPGPRYQYVSAPDGLHLEDLWVKTSDLAASARYNPEVDNGYHLFTRSNPRVSQPLPMGYESILRASNFDPSKKTVVLVHGWKNTPLSDFNVYLIHAYLAAEDVNVIMTDWSKGASEDYVPAMLNNIQSGPQVAKFLQWVNSVTGASVSRYHLIGHSLGAHQAAIIGRLLNGQIPYVTGLDPALPGWITNPHRISPEVGIYTEIIHTDVGQSGIMDVAGDTDFYPNGGRGMPGCSDRSCDHHKCIFYMAESLTNGGFTGRSCNILGDAVILGRCDGPTTLRMGGPNPKTGSTGIYHLTTNASPPYSQG